MKTLTLVYDQEFRELGRRRQAWGTGLLAVASLIWLWLAFQLFVPFTIDRAGSDVDCESRVFYDSGRSHAPYDSAEGERCSVARDLAPMLAALVVSLPFAAVGTILCATGSAAVRTSVHAAEIIRLTESSGA